MVLAIAAKSDRLPGRQLSESSAWLVQKQASDITRAHGGVPGGMNVAGVVRGDVVVLAVVNQDIGIRLAADRAVQVLEARGPPRHTTPVVIIKSAVDFRKMH